MSDLAINLDRLFDLMGVVCDEDASQDEITELETLAIADRGACRRYLGYCRMHSTLRLALRAHRATQEVHQQIDIESIIPALSDSGIVKGKPPAPTFLSTTLHGTVGYFSSGWPLAYLVATVIFGIGLLVGSVVHVSQPVQVVRQSSVPSGTVAEPKMELVGRITGMVDCKWADQATTPVGDNDNIILGRKFALASGLMEITYDTGAKVILQGPVTYEVESRNGGFLPVGKLTGKVEVEVAKGFSVRTPTATVTDLGTEFGVEVDKQGNTASCVFRGSVKMQIASGDGETEPATQVLHENQSARVEGGGDHRIYLLAVSKKPVGFVRDIVRPTIRTLDLADVVAGGDGFSGRRNRGIDPTTGQVSSEPPTSPNQPGGAYPKGDYQYHRVKGNPFVDGVFIPDGSKGPVQVDSAGHTFDGFSKTSNIGTRYVWAGLSPYRDSSTLAGIDYASPGRGILFLHVNKGITFDLDAMRRANPSCRLLRFRAVAGNTEVEAPLGAGVANLTVLVDGQMRWCRREINGTHGAMVIAVPIQEKDRFLTLVADDAGSAIWSNSIVFGDPRIELMATEPQGGQESQPKPP